MKKILIAAITTIATLITAAPASAYTCGDLVTSCAGSGDPSPQCQGVSSYMSGYIATNYPSIAADPSAVQVVGQYIGLYCGVSDDHLQYSLPVVIDATVKSLREHGKIAE